MAHQYVQGHSDSTVATHLLRTAETDAAFLLPYIKPTDCILDFGCGPGAITVGFVKYASVGKVVGVDISADVLERAKKLASQSDIPAEGPGSVMFVQGDILKGLSYPENTFDIVYASQPGGILATRDGVEQHFYPCRFELDRLWVGNLIRVVNHGKTDAKRTATVMPALFRNSGFDADGGNIRVGAATTVYSTPEARKWLADRAAGQLKPGDPFYLSWLDAGITQEEIEQTLLAARTWAEEPDAWFVSVQCEMLAWK